MAKHFKKALSAFLALLMCVSTFAPAVMAEEATQWLGADAKLNIAPGDEPYVYAIAQDPANNRWYYETSNHTVLKEVTGGGAVHIFPIVDTTKVTGEWTPDGIYQNGVSNYDVMYCCDAITGTDGEIYYKRVNLEDSEYFTTEEAKRLRAIVENAYPYVSVEEAKAALEAAGFKQADELDRSELITATQAAIWTIANPDSGDSYRYNKTATTAHKLTWGGYMHEFAAEITNFADSTTAKKYLTNPNGTGDRVNALIDFYLALPGVEAEAGQIVISNLEIKNSKIAGSDDTYKVTLGVELNHGADDNDDVKLNVYLNGELVEESVAINEETEYTVDLEAKAKDKIKVEVTGMQNLERGVYFYAPKPQDIDGDGIATSREVSQNLIGVGSGETPVHAERNFTVDIVNVDLEINKVDGNGNSLSGAKFAIYDEEGQLVDTKTVGEDGTLVFAGLVPGTYSLKETVAPFGYILPKGTIEVVIGEDGTVTFDGVELEGETTTTDPVVIEGEAVKSPEITVDLVPGGETENTETSVEDENAAKTLVAVRKVTATMTEVEVTVNTLSNGVASVLPALKFDRNDAADQKAQKVTTELYTDNGHFHDPDTFTVTDAPEGYPFKYVGHGDYSGHYVSHIRVIYAKDEAGNALKDENGNYVIDHLEHVSSGTPLYYNGELSTNVQGPFHYATGTRPQQFLLKNEQGDLIYGYCIDLETGADSDTWYAIANLEDNDYYASEEAENHIRNIIENGYWGTAEGTGSLASLKAALKTAVANGVVDKEYDVNLVNRKAFTTGYELQEGEYHYGNYVYWNVIPVDGENHVVLTDDIINGLTEGEALDAMQMAIWTFANGAMATLDGKDDVIVGDPYAASSQMSDSLNGKNDYAGAARTKALYNYLISLDDPKESSVVINDKTFAENMSLTVGNKIGDGIYKASLHFSLPVELGEQDNLTVKLTYVDAYGETQTIECPLTGEGAIESVNGIYTIDDLNLKAGEAFDFSLNIYGGQYLEKSAYILTSQGGTNASQTMVTLAEGMNTVDVTKSASIVFEVEDHAEVTYNRYSYSVEIENVPEELEGDKKSEHIDGNRFEISIEVPGGDAEVKHDEVILMVDGSYSMDNEWPAMVEAITTIGEAVLDGSGHTQLTLMAFGMGDNEVLVHVKTVEELAAALGELPGTLLYGRSSTNCEAGFTGVAEYIANHDETLGEVNVIFISDGNLNTDETPRAFDANWKTWTKFGALAVAQETFGGTVGNGANLPAAFTTVFGNRFDGATREEIIERAFGGEVTDAEFLAFAEQVWTDVYAYSGLTRGEEYPISDAERAFVKYDKENGTYIQDLFYYTTYKSAYVTYGDRWTRTPVAADALAAMDEVKALYVVDYDGYTSWMDTGITSEKSTFVQSNGIAGLIEALESTLKELALTPFNNVVITDYMSKWVNLDATTIKIVDVSAGETIWTNADGWLITEGRPTAKDVPVVVELVDPADYAAGGNDVIGNTSGDIYKLTWYVKDGALLRSDNYKLVYEVKVDTAEEDFVYDFDYPANGNTNIHYDGIDEKEIIVPDVVSITGTVTLKKVDENGKLISGAVFALYKIENGTESLVGRYNLDDGIVEISNLAVGSYKLVEVQAPNGYIGINDPMYFEIVRTKDGELEAKNAYEIEFPATAYEISNHITSVAIPQTFVLLDAENAKNWEYSGEFIFGASDYDVVYCADSETGVVDGTKYYRVDLEDLFGTENAAKLRAIVANSYPYVSVADMIAAAAAANVADAENLTRGDIIAAVQLAIWHYTNGIENYEYKATYSVEAYPRWGKVFHDYSNEIGESLPNDNNTEKIVDGASDARIRALYNYLIALESDAAEGCDTDVFAYVPQGGKDASQMLIGSTHTDFYTDDMEITVVNVAEKEIEKLESDKKSEHIDGNRFKISIEVPGAGMERKHDDVILMVDGSYSGDKEWPAMKEAINAIGRTVLNGNGNTQLTLMAFGMGDNYVLEHIVDADALAAALGELPGNLLRGVSSTNCEAGFTGVKEFVETHEADLKDAIVIFISDGGINTDETPRKFYNWTEYAPNVDTVISYALNGTELPEGITQAEKIELVNNIWKDVFALSNMDINGEYPISEMERAFLVYAEDPANANGWNVYYSFLMAMKGSKFDSYPNVWNRTYNSVFDLAKVEDVKDLYLVRYTNDGRATWMPEATAVSENDNIHYVKSDSISTLTDALEGTLEDLALTPYNNVVITDYMSKWVNLDPSTLKIVDVSTGEPIWTKAHGWLIDENRPTAEEIPVVVELVDPAAYDDGGEDVIGNTSGDIYKLTWYVKDGALLRSDNYKLVYEVEVDTEENGFEYGVDYPANGNTTANYNDLYGMPTIYMISVPNVTPEAPETLTITFKKGEASNISFMLIDKKTGKVEFLKKIDIGNQTSFEIPSEEGKISAVFVKQSTSGMFWFAEEVDKATQQAVINCLKKNNTSYKGYNAIAFGEGDHELEFKKNKFVTYTFSGKVVDTETEKPETGKPEMGGCDNDGKPETEKPETGKPEAEKPVTPPVVEKPEAEKPVAKTLNYKVNGAKITSWTVVDGITAIYIKGSGKVPSVLWTSEKAKGMTLINILVELDLLNNLPEYQFDTVGAHTFHYEQNKNKIKSVTYTFIEK